MNAFVRSCGSSAAALVLLFAACGQRGAAPPAARPNVLLVTIDTWRADRLGVGLTPAIDAIASTGIRFTAARATVPLTLPSHATILTGLLPPAHGVRENGLDRLDPAHRTVASLLKDAGYRTGAFVGAFVLDRRFGLSAGFDTYDDQVPRDPAAVDRLEAERPAAAVVDRALAWLDAGSRETGAAPFFAWVHLYDPHAPYQAPAAYADRVRQLQRAPGGAAYDAEVLYADAQVGRVFDRLRADGRLDRTLVIVAGDHGEGLGDHGERTHGMLLYDSTLRVPLVVRAPGAAAAIRADTVSLADLAPTIARAAGVAPPAGATGHDLLAAPAAAAESYAETDYPRVAGWSPLQALADGRWKTIRAARGVEVYDLANDPSEQHDLAATQAGVARGMTTRIEALRAAGAGPRAEAPVSPEAAERLRALGYVSGPSAPAPADAPSPAQGIAAWNTFEDALAALNLGRPDALAALQRIVAAHPESMVFQSTLARGWKDRGQPTRALALYREALARWPREPRLYHDLAVAARDAAAAAAPAAARALRDEARRAEQAALALAPADAAALNGLGLLAIDEGRASEAAQAFERAAALDATNASYWCNLGNARRAAGDATGAEQAYRRALAVDATAVDALNGIGVLLVERQQPGAAVEWFERAVAASPGFVEAQLNLGIALQQAGQHDRAASVYRSVLAAPGPHAREKQAARNLLGSMGAR